MSDSIVVKCIIWPHEVVLMAGSHPTMYEELSPSLFVSGYLAILETVKANQKDIILKHLIDLM